MGAAQAGRRFAQMTWMVAACSAVGLTACDDDDGGGATADAAGGAGAAGGEGGQGGAGAEGGVGGAGAEGGIGGAGAEGGVGGAGAEGGEGGEGGGTPRPDCDDLDPARCALPWPSSLYLTPDARRTTGFRLDFGPTTLPANAVGAHIDPAPYARLDGYGFQTPGMVILPNLDASTLPDETRIADSLAEDADILFLQVGEDNLERVPYFAELDPKEPDPTQKVLFIRPAVLLQPNTRYVIALRNLRDTGGAPIPPSAAFAALRDGATAGDPALAARQAHFNEVLAYTDAVGVDRASLNLAWDFRTASREALHGWLLHMRDDGLARTGPSGPELTVTDVIEYAPEADDTGREVNAHIALEVRGKFIVPQYMEPWGESLGTTGERLRIGADGRPEAQGTRAADYWLRVPHSALSGRPHGLVIYGHGQLGRGSQVRGGDKGPVANENDLIFFACDMVGMSAEEETKVPQMLLDMTYFPWIADRLHQGLLEHVLLTRAMRERLDALAPMTERGITVDKSRVFYSGISQGGIFGATFMALTPDITRGHLGVPGMDYFTLLGRSQNFVPLFIFLEQGYPDVADQWITLQAAQQLWNQTDPATYYRHITHEPLPGNQPHYVIAAPAQGDYQVAPLTMETVARSDIGIPLLTPYARDRAVPLAAEASYPHVGSGIVNWDFGNAWPAPGNQPPANDPAGDPHGKPRQRADHNRQMVHFFDTGEIIDVCDGAVCGDWDER